MTAINQPKVATLATRHHTQTHIETLRSLEARALDSLQSLRRNELEHRSILAQIAKLREEKERTAADLVARLREQWRTPTARMDALGRCVAVQDTWLQEFGWTFKQVEKNAWQALVHPDDALDMLPRFHRAVATREVYAGEYRLLRNDLKFQMVRTVLRPLSNSLGQYAGSEALVVSI